jgi:hypothetical protein
MDVVWVPDDEISPYSGMDVVWVPDDEISPYHLHPTKLSKYKNLTMATAETCCF